MLAKRLIACLMLLVLCVGLSPVQAQDELQAVVVARQAIPRGTLLDDDLVFGENALVEIVFYPTNFVPISAIQSLEGIINTYARTDIPAEAPIVAHYLLPNPILRSDPASFTISPRGYRVGQDINIFREVRAESLDPFTMPATLAAGDRVDMLRSSQLGDMLQDETRLFMSDVAIVQITPEGSITFAVPIEQEITLQSYLETGLPLTLVLRIDEVPPFEGAMTWESLQSRPENPLLPPDNADLSEYRPIPPTPIPSEETPLG